jgi:DMSO/TMAO reductase YedYZ molybdopterin-dependent catalytic subunit
VGAVETPQRWNWVEFHTLPREPISADIHCVTKWSKFDTMWEGVALDTLLDAAKPQGQYVLVFCDGGYTTNLPLADVLNHRAWIVDTYEGAPLPSEHGGPAWLLVPHLYFWKSAKWVRGLHIVTDDQPGFWESYGYHNYGDPWKEQRYQGD